MKEKLIKKEIRRMYDNVVCVGYCNLYHFTNKLNCIGYISGIYGWYADVYQLSNDICIVTGYQPFGNLELTREQEKEIEEMTKNCQTDAEFEEVKEKVIDFILGEVE